MPGLKVGECVRYGWETFKKRPWFLIGAVVLALAISAIPGMFGPQPEIGPDGKLIPPPMTAHYAVVSLISIVVSFLVGLGLATFSLRAHDNIEAVQLGDLWNPGPFWRFVGAHILTVLAVMLGLIAFIVPGVMLAIGFSFVPYLVIERGLGPVEAMQESWRITKGHKWTLLLLFLALLGIDILGLLALGVGVFVAFPVTMLAFAHAYRTIGPRPQ